MLARFRIAMCAALVVACDGEMMQTDAGRDPDPDSGGPPDVPVQIIVDADIVPSVDAMPGLEAGADARPVAGVIVDDGVIASFVEAELVVGADSRGDADAIAERWAGEVIAELVGTSVPGVPQLYLVRIDPALADLGAFSPDLVALAPGARGDVRVSSERGAGTLAAAAREAAAGVEVAVNWVANGADPVSRSTNDIAGPSGDSCGSGTTHSANAFEWPYMISSAVPEAWRAMALAGRNEHALGIAIIDGGLRSSHPDLTLGVVPLINLANPFPIPPDTENTMRCTGGRECPWHGTGAVLTAMGRPDNGFGAAGPAGYVASAIVIPTLGDMFTTVGALVTARVGGAAIASMSFGASIHWFFEWTIWPLEATTSALHREGLLMFAAAGNDNRDVDATECPISDCLEAAFVYPCENSGVICVGATDMSGTRRASYSNFGTRPLNPGPDRYVGSVDLWASGTEYIARVPPRTAENETETFCGTSSAAPFAAGVAAMIWATDPAQSAAQVEDRLLRLATEVTGEPHVYRYVNAYRPVVDVIGGVPNTPPTIVIDEPMDGAVLRVEETHTFRATASDEDEGTPTITWSTSAGDTIFGSGPEITITFATRGPRTITATARDSSSLEVPTSIDVVVENTAPSAIIVEPAPSATFYRGQSIALRGRGAEVSGPDLPCSALYWSAETGSAPSGLPARGCNPVVRFNGDGPASIRLLVTDPFGAMDTVVVPITIVPPPADPPPTGSILTPANGARYDVSAVVPLSSTVMNEPSGQTVSIRWIGEWIDGTPRSVTLATSMSADWRPADHIGARCDPIPVHIRLELSDGVTTNVVDTRDIVIDCPPG